MTLQAQMNTLNIQDTISPNQLEIDNAYLKQQNELLTKELSFTRYTINALKNMTNQRDVIINETRQELERALQHIQLLSYKLNQQQRDLSGIGPQLIHDESSEELSEEDEIYEEQQQHRGRSTMDIMSKLPLRQQQNQIYIHDLVDY